MTDDPFLAVAADLRAIRDMHDALPDQAAHKATARLMPGGLAMVALGPVASIEDRERRGELIEAEWLSNPEHDPTDKHRPNPWADEYDDWYPPLQSLLVWSEEWRNVHDKPIDRPTEQTEATFLLDVLAWAYDHDPHWDDFCKEVRAARRRLEDVLYDGERQERSWVPCLYCDLNRDGKPMAVRLVMVYGPAVGADRWVCPRCKTKYDEAGFHQAQRKALDTNDEPKSA